VTHTIKSAINAAALSMTITSGRLSDSTIFIGMDDRGGVHVDRARFIDAVEAECGVEIYDNDAPMRLVPSDAIVILRDELPEVAPDTRNGGSRIDGEHSFETDPAECRRWAMRYLALAEHLDSPPVDEAQVEAIYDVAQSALNEAGVTMGQIDHGVRMDVARRLYLAGVRIEPTEKEN